MTYALTTTVPSPFETTLDAVREALTEQGFGVLTEIDLAATLKEKIGEQIAPQTILGACRPPLAHAAVVAEPSVGLLLPCNVAVRSTDDGDDASTIVEALDPAIMVEVTANPGLGEVARDARERLVAALGSLGGTPLS